MNEVPIACREKENNTQIINIYFIILANGEHVHPLPARGEDELGVDIQITINVANTAAGSGLHDADCSAYFVANGSPSGVSLNSGCLISSLFSPKGFPDLRSNII